MVFVIYIAFFFLILRFCVTLFNFISNPKLDHSPRRFDEKVSVIVYEPPLISGAQWLQSLLDQNHQNFEVLYYSTNTLFDQEREENVKVFHAADFGKEILNRTQAFHHLAKHAEGNYLLFMDANLTVQDDLLDNCINRMKIHGLSVLSIFSDMEIRFNSQYSIWTLWSYLLLNLYPLRLIRLLPAPFLSIANRQFLFCEAEFFRSLAPFSRKTGLDEMSFVKSVKPCGGKLESLLANGQLIHPVPSHFQQINQAAVRLGELFGASYLAMFICAFWLCLVPVFILVLYNPVLFIFYGSLVLLNRLMVSLMSNQDAGKSLLYHPLSISMFGVIASAGLGRLFRKKI